MIPCKHCLTSNSLDSTFCKHCGGALPADELAEAKTKLDELIQAGFNLLKENRGEEAMMVAEQAIESNPSNPTAFSLKGMCHEGRGEIAEALEAYERVVELNPDSSLDKIKVTQLRNVLAAKATAPIEVPDRKPAVLAGVAAAVLVAVLGFAVARGISKPAPVVAKNEAAGPTGPQPVGFVDNTNLYRPNPAASPTPSADAGTVPPVTSGPVASNNAPSTGLPSRPIPSYGGQTLPNPEISGQIRPFDPGNISITPTNPQPAPTPAPNRAEPETPGTATTNNPTPQATTPLKNDGYIEVTVSNSGRRPSGGGGGNNDASSQANGQQAVLAAARNNYQLGRFAEAARGFAQAIAMGAGSASVYQRYGDALRQSGQTAEAIRAYEQAAALFERQGNNAGAEACRQHVKTLRGG